MGPQGVRSPRDVNSADCDGRRAVTIGNVVITLLGVTGSIGWKCEVIGSQQEACLRDR